MSVMHSRVCEPRTVLEIVTERGSMAQVGASTASKEASQ